MSAAPTVLRVGVGQEADAVPLVHELGQAVHVGGHKARGPAHLLPPRVPGPHTSQAAAAARMR